MCTYFRPSSKLKNISFSYFQIRVGNSFGTGEIRCGRLRVTKSLDYTLKTTITTTTTTTTTALVIYIFFNFRAMFSIVLPSVPLDRHNYLKNGFGISSFQLSVVKPKQSNYFDQSQNTMNQSELEENTRNRPRSSAGNTCEHANKS